MKILEVKNVKKSYTLYGKEKVPVLHGLNLSFETGNLSPSSANLAVVSRH